MIPFFGEDGFPINIFSILPDKYDCLPAMTAFLNASAIDIAEPTFLATVSLKYTLSLGFFRKGDLIAPTTADAGVTIRFSYNCVAKLPTVFTRYVLGEDRQLKYIN